MTALSRIFRALVASICAYEVAALTTRRMPTVSAICTRRPWLIPVIVGGLTVHLVRDTLASPKEPA